MEFNECFAFEALWDSMWKCKRGKMKKKSVANFVVHGPFEVLKLEEQYADSSYHPRKPKTITVTYPKVRHCSSIHIRDRIMQRSANDNYIYPRMTRSFIYDNMACQKGKGTVKAMNRFETLLHRYYVNNGNSNAGLDYQFDITKYYQSMRHDIARECFLKHLDQSAVDKCFEWLNYQYPGDIGYEPGSQMVQILGISVPDDIDHKIKERLTVDEYERYMDDFNTLGNDKNKLEENREAIEYYYRDKGFELSKKKTKVFPINRGIKYLGFTFFLTSSGHVYKIIDPDNVKHERKKLYRLVQLCKQGKKTKRKADECYRSWEAHAKLGDTYKMRKRMRDYYNNLWRSEYENCTFKG